MRALRLLTVFFMLVVPVSAIFASPLVGLLYAPLFQSCGGLVNGDFEVDLAGWTLNTSTGGTITHSAYLDNYAALGTDTTNNSQRLFISQTVTFLSGSYTITLVHNNRIDAQILYTNTNTVFSTNPVSETVNFYFSLTQTTRLDFLLYFGTGNSGVAYASDVSIAGDCASPTPTPTPTLTPTPTATFTPVPSFASAGCRRVTDTTAVTTTVSWGNGDNSTTYYRFGDFSTGAYISVTVYGSSWSFWYVGTQYEFIDGSWVQVPVTNTTIGGPAVVAAVPACGPVWCSYTPARSFSVPFNVTTSVVLPVDAGLAGFTFPKPVSPSSFTTGRDNRLLAYDVFVGDVSGLPVCGAVPTATPRPTSTPRPTVTPRFMTTISAPPITGSLGIPGITNTVTFTPAISSTAPCLGFTAITLSVPSISVFSWSSPTFDRVIDGYLVCWDEYHYEHLYIGSTDMLPYFDLMMTIVMVFTIIYYVINRR